MIYYFRIVKTKLTKRYYHLTFDAETKYSVLTIVLNMKRVWGEARVKTDRDTVTYSYRNMLDMSPKPKTRRKKK
jgi:hypothetical protein